MRSEPARVGKISLNSAEIPPRRDENFSYEHAQVGSLAKRDRVFFNILTFALHDGFTSLFIEKTTLSNNLFSAT